MQMDEKRKEIDEIDGAIVELLHRRASVSREISVLKMGAGLPIRDADREAEILRRLCRVEQGDNENEYICRIYEKVLDESRRIQAQTRHEIVLNGVIR